MLLLDLTSKQYANNAVEQSDAILLAFEAEVSSVVFGLFKSKPYQDLEFGEFTRSRGHWNAQVALAPSGTFRLSLSGDHNSPHPDALRLLGELQKHFPSLVARIERGLFEHYVPYKEAVEDGIEISNSFPQIATSVEVWPHVKPAHVLIEPLNGLWRVEIAFTTEWDIEHTVAAIYSNWQFIELNGSVRGI